MEAREWEFSQPLSAIRRSASLLCPIHNLSVTQKMVRLELSGLRPWPNSAAALLVPHVCGGKIIDHPWIFAALAIVSVLLSSTSSQLGLFPSD